MQYTPAGLLRQGWKNERTKFILILFFMKNCFLFSTKLIR